MNNAQSRTPSVSEVMTVSGTYTKFVVAERKPFEPHHKAGLPFKVCKGDAKTGEPIPGTFVGAFTNREVAEIVADALNRDRTIGLGVRVNPDHN